MHPVAFNAFNHPFWRFSLAFYELPRVQALTLVLQDEQGLDVNLLLFACWLGRQGRRLQGGSPALDRIRRWQTEIIQPLRTLRRAQSRETEAGRRLRRMLQETELKAEQCEQWLLFQAVPELSDPSDEPLAALTEANLQELVAPASLSDTVLLERLHQLAELNQLEISS